MKYEYENKNKQKIYNKKKFSFHRKTLKKKKTSHDQRYQISQKKLKI